MNRFEKRTFVFSCLLKSKGDSRLEPFVFVMVSNFLWLLSIFTETSRLPPMKFQFHLFVSSVRGFGNTRSQKACSCSRE